MYSYPIRTIVYILIDGFLFQFHAVKCLKKSLCQTNAVNVFTSISLIVGHVEQVLRVMLQHVTMVAIDAVGSQRKQVQQQ